MGCHHGRLQGSLRRRQEPLPQSHEQVLGLSYCLSYCLRYGLSYGLLPKLLLIDFVYKIVIYLQEPGHFTVSKSSDIYVRGLEGKNGSIIWALKSKTHSSAAGTKYQL